MRFQRSAAILALVHLSLVAAVPGNLINRLPHAEPISPVAKTLIDRSTTSSKDSYFMLENFYAWIPSPSAPLHPRASGSATVTPSASSLSPSSAPKQFSSTFFTLKFMPPMAPADQESQPQWQVRCWNLTAELLCQPDVWRPCGNATYMNGTVVPQEQEEVSWRFGEGLGRIELMRQWAYTSEGVLGQPGQTTRMTTMASEATDWAENGNMTVSQMGRKYERPDGWRFDWQQTWA